jgi:hypothetical protein
MLCHAVRYLGVLPLSHCEKPIPPSSLAGYTSSTVRAVSSESGWVTLSVGRKHFLLDN